MGLETLHYLKEVTLEAASLLTLVMACVALLLIEFWGIRKIWKLVWK